MTRFRLTMAFIAGFALAATPALAQRPTQDSGSPRGEASPRGGGGGSPAPSAPSDGGAATSSSSSSSSSESSAPSAGSSGGASPSHHVAGRSAPEHRVNPVDRGAAARGEAGSHGTATSRPTEDRAGAEGRHAVRGDDQVPAWSRPRGDNPVTGTAVPRTTPPLRGDRGYGYYYPGSYYDPYSCWLGYYPCGGYGYGYNRYPPYGYYVPWGYGFGMGLWYPGDPFAYGSYYDPYGGYGGASSGYNYSQSSSQGVDQGAVRLKVKPRDAKVYVDGYLVGVVDSFDGVFQKLNIPAGRPHKIEVKADGYETATFDVVVATGETVTYQGELKRIQ